MLVLLCNRNENDRYRFQAIMTRRGLTSRERKKDGWSFRYQSSEYKRKTNRSLPSTCSLSYHDSSHRARDRRPSPAAACSLCSRRSLTADRPRGIRLRTFVSSFLVRCSANPCGLVPGVYDSTTGYCCIDIAPAYTDSRCTCPNNVQTINTPCRKEIFVSRSYLA